MRRPLFALLLASGCNHPARDSTTARQARLTARAAAAPHYDTAVFVARQAGEPVSTVSAVMQLRVVGRDAQVTVENEAGRQASAGAPGGDRLEEIPGSRVTVLSDLPEDSLRAPWRATVNVPVLEGERYLVELYPSTPRLDSAAFELSADGHILAASRVPADVTTGEPALFEVAVGAQAIAVSPQIERIEIVPTCGTSHVVRSGGRADLYARYEVVGTGETGDLHLPPRDADARFRGVTFRTRTKGDVVIRYLGHELARAARPEGCTE